MNPLDREPALPLTERIRNSLFPRIEPELRPARAELARRIILFQLGFLSLWALGLIVLSSNDDQLRVGMDLASIGVLALASGFGLWLLRRGSLNAVGYVTSFMLFVLVAAGALFAPMYYLLISVVLLLPILISSALLGGTAPYVFAVLAIGVDVAVLVRSPEILDGTMLRVIFFTTHAAVVLATATISGSLSAQVQRTLQSMHLQARQMGKLAHTDPLTGLPNRRQLFEQLQMEFARAKRYTRPFCLLYIDLDSFKAINDQFGHLFGDEILRGSARSMRSVLRATDSLARIGGDEFAVLLPETDLPGAVSVASKLRKALMAYGSQLSPSMSSLSLSVGVGQIKEQDEAIEDILARADKAQYLAKSSGKALTRTQDDLEQPQAAHPA